MEKTLDNQFGEVVMKACEKFGFSITPGMTPIEFWKKCCEASGSNALTSILSDYQETSSDFINEMNGITKEELSKRKIIA